MPGRRFGSDFYALPTQIHAFESFFFLKRAHIFSLEFYCSYRLPVELYLKNFFFLFSYYVYAHFPPYSRVRLGV